MNAWTKRPESECVNAGFSTDLCHSVAMQVLRRPSVTPLARRPEHAATVTVYRDRLAGKLRAVRTNDLGR